MKPRRFFSTLATHIRIAKKKPWSLCTFLSVTELLHFGTPPILANVDNIKENGKHKYLRVHVSVYASHLFTMSQRLWVQIMCTSCEIKLLAIHTKAIVQRV